MNETDFEKEEKGRKEYWMYGNSWHFSKFKKLLENKVHLFDSLDVENIVPYVQQFWYFGEICI